MGASGCGPILVVDDDEIVAAGLLAALHRDGYEAVAVRDGHAALASLARERFALVVTDLRMPGVSGIDVVAAAGRSQPETPVFVVSGYPVREAAQAAQRCGAALFLVKPIDYPRLRGFIEEHVGTPAPDAASAWEGLR